MREIAIARLILWIMIGSYLLSAVLLTFARIAGQSVPLWKICAWAGTAIIAAALLPWLSGNRPLVSAAIALVLISWMGFAMFEDTHSRHFLIAVIDLAGLLATVYAIWLVRA